MFHFFCSRAFHKICSKRKVHSPRRNIFCFDQSFVSKQCPMVNMSQHNQSGRVTRMGVMDGAPNGIMTRGTTMGKTVKMTCSGTIPSLVQKTIGRCKIGRTTVVRGGHKKKQKMKMTTFRTIHVRRVDHSTMIHRPEDVDKPEDVECTEPIQGGRRGAERGSRVMSEDPVMRTSVD